MKLPRNRCPADDGGAQKQLDYFRGIVDASCLNEDEGYSIRSMAWRHGIKLSQAYPQILEQVIEKLTLQAIRERLLK